VGCVLLLLYMRQKWACQAGMPDVQLSVRQSRAARQALQHCSSVTGKQKRDFASLPLNEFATEAT
jgi:hypothetical protein